MNKRLKLLLAWKAMNGEEHQPGTVLEVDAETFKTLTKENSEGQIVAKSFSEAEEQAEKDAEQARADQMEQVAQATAQKVLAGINGGGDGDDDAGQPFMTLSIGKDLAHDDQWGGYMQRQALDGRYSDAEKQYAFGAYCNDVMQAELDISNKSERLKNMQARSEEMIEKQAEFLNPVTKASIAVTGPQGVGYLMPPAMSTMLLDRAAQVGYVRPRAAKIDITGAGLDLPYVRDVDNSNDILHGGIVAYWTGESKKYKESDMDIDQLSLKLDKLTCLAFVTDEVRRFSPISAGSWIIPRFGDAIAWKEDLAFQEGDGAGKPLGMLAAQNKGLITIAKESGQAADSLVEANVTKAFSRLRVVRESSVAWVTNRQNFPTLFGMVDANGNRLWVNTVGGPGGSQPTIASRPLSSFLGYPVEYNEKRPLIGDKGDLALVDWSQYLVGDDRQGPEVAQSIHLRFDQGETAFRLTKFVTGRPVNKEAYKPKKGDPIGAAVQIAERA